MVLKLIKHEFKYLGKYLLLIWAGLLSAIVLQRIISDFIDHENQWLQFAATMAMSTLVLTLIAMAFITFGIVIMRFYQNMFTGEGYLTFTLPVKTWQIIFSKLFVGFCVMLLPMATIIAIFFSYTNKNEFLYILNQFVRLYHEMDVPLWIQIIWILSIFIGIINSILEFYLAMSLGQLANRNKIIFSIIAYGVIYFIKQVIATIISVILMISWSDLPLDYLQNIDTVMGIASLPSFLLVTGISIIEWFMVVHLCKNKLNLE